MICQADAVSAEIQTVGSSFPFIRSRVPVLGVYRFLQVFAAAYRKRNPDPDGPDSDSDKPPAAFIFYLVSDSVVVGRFVPENFFGQPESYKTTSDGSEYLGHCTVGIGLFHIA